MAIDTPPVSSSAHSDYERLRAHLAAIVDSSDDAIVSKTLQGIILSWNRGAERIFGYTPEEAVGKHITLIIPKDRHHEEQQIIARLSRGERVDHYETIRQRKDGSLFPISLTISPIRDESGRIVAASKIARDITGQRQMQEQLKASLREKDIMLKEIHHRVKNNMQVISSLLSLQSQYIDDPRMLALFQDSQNRVKSMALIHERLYRSNDLAKIGMHAYLEDLVREITHSRMVHERVTIQINAGDVTLELDTAIPCALIIHELLTNALEHAFSIGEEGMVAIRMAYAPPDLCRLEVSDTGKGLPPGFDPKKSDTLGLTLVSALVEQLNGALSVRSSPGATFMITFSTRMEKSQL